jgi:hypothetical protein
MFTKSSPDFAKAPVVRARRFCFLCAPCPCFPQSARQAALALLLFGLAVALAGTGFLGLAFVVALAGLFPASAVAGRVFDVS